MARKEKDGGIALRIETGVRRVGYGVVDGYRAGGDHAQSVRLQSALEAEWQVVSGEGWHRRSPKADRLSHPPPLSCRSDVLSFRCPASEHASKCASIVIAGAQAIAQFIAQDKAQALAQGLAKAKALGNAHAQAKAQARAKATAPAWLQAKTLAG
jgi:flagellar biosynthesis/type III secretory pathway protein FliH